MSATTLSFTPDSSGPFTKPNILPLLVTLGLQDANNAIYDVAIPGITLTAATTNGAITPGTRATYIITKAGVLAMTLAAPTATTDDGKVITFISSTANAHTLTATGLLKTGVAGVNVATWTNVAGASLTLMAYQALWYVVSSNGITFS